MFHADKKIGENLGGVILHHETIYQKDDNGKRNCSFFTIGLSYFRISYRIYRKMNLWKNCRWFDRARDLERDQNWSGLDVDAWYHGRNDYSRLRRAFELMSESCMVTILYEVSSTWVKKSLVRQPLWKICSIQERRMCFCKGLAYWITNF